MPIYSYKCEECGHSADILQKLSDPTLKTCPKCHKESFSKQLTSAGFVLKGGGWYVTDFRDQQKKDNVKQKPEKSGKNGIDKKLSSNQDSKSDSGVGSKETNLSKGVEKPSKIQTGKKEKPSEKKK